MKHLSKIFLDFNNMHASAVLNFFTIKLMTLLLVRRDNYENTDLLV